MGTIEVVFDLSSAQFYNEEEIFFTLEEAVSSGQLGSLSVAAEEVEWIPGKCCYKWTILAKLIKSGNRYITCVDVTRKFCKRKQ